MLLMRSRYSGASIRFLEALVGAPKMWQAYDLPSLKSMVPGVVGQRNSPDAAIAERNFDGLPGGTSAGGEVIKGASGLT